MIRIRWIILVLMSGGIWTLVGCSGTVPEEKEATERYLQSKQMTGIFKYIKDGQIKQTRNFHFEFKNERFGIDKPLILAGRVRVVNDPQGGYSCTVLSKNNHVEKSPERQRLVRCVAEKKDQSTFTVDVIDNSKEYKQFIREIIAKKKQFNRKIAAETERFNRKIAEERERSNRKLAEKQAEVDRAKKLNEGKFKVFAFDFGGIRNAANKRKLKRLKKCHQNLSHAVTRNLMLLEMSEGMSSVFTVKRDNLTGRNYIPIETMIDNMDRRFEDSVYAQNGLNLTIFTIDHLWEGINKYRVGGKASTFVEYIREKPDIIPKLLKSIYVCAPVGNSANAPITCRQIFGGSDHYKC